MEKKADIIDLLLRPETPNVKKQRPTAEYKVKRLSELYGEPVIFSLRALSYNEIQELAGAEDFDTQVILTGVASPDLRDARLLEHFHCPTPAELVTSVFLPGEVSELVQAIEKLSGYRRIMLEEVKKN